MVEFRWIKMSLFLMLVLQFMAAAAADRQLLLSFNVRVGDDVTLSCESVIDDQNNCDSTTWTFRDSRDTESIALVTLGHIDRLAETNSDRLNVTESCSLVIKEVAVEDAGRYNCQQNKSGQKQGQDAQVHLSVVTMTEEKNNDEVTLSCSVSTYGRCTHKVKWLYNSNDLDDNQDVRTSQSSCSASVAVLTSHHIYTSRFNFLKCEVTDGYTRKVQQFPLSRQPSDEKPGEETITEPTMTTTPKPTTATDYASANLKDWWWLFLTVAAVLLALLIIVVIVIKWKRTKESKTQMNDIALTSNPAVSQSPPDTSQDKADPDPDPEDDISYATVSYTKKTNSKAQVQSKNHDEGDAVTYMTLKASSAGPNKLYATINEPK